MHWGKKRKEDMGTGENCGSPYYEQPTAASHTPFGAFSCNLGCRDAAFIHVMACVFHTFTPTFRCKAEGSVPSGKPRVKGHRTGGLIGAPAHSLCATSHLSHMEEGYPFLLVGHYFDGGGTPGQKEDRRCVSGWSLSWWASSPSCSSPFWRSCWGNPRRRKAYSW
jgi:hypothetical protein